jgi:hypothetical protein
MSMVLPFSRLVGFVGKNNTGSIWTRVILQIWFIQRVDISQGAPTLLVGNNFVKHFWKWLSRRGSDLQYIFDLCKYLCRAQKAWRRGMRLPVRSFSTCLIISVP